MPADMPAAMMTNTMKISPPSSSMVPSEPRPISPGEVGLRQLP